MIEQRHPVPVSGRPQWCGNPSCPICAPNPTFLDTQVGGDHYKNMAIQPTEYIHANGIGFIAGNIIKYISRYQSKNGMQDLEKAKHYLEILIELEGDDN